MKLPISQLPHADLSHKRVFVRADLNVPLDKGIITNDYRLRALKPTLDLILRKGGKIILATHIGRPTGVDESLSTKHLIPWFTKHGYNVHFESDLIQAKHASHKKWNSILLLENLRFFPGEKQEDANFTKLLAQTADYYVNDAFATLHRHDASVTKLPLLFDQHHRTIGLLIEQELRSLSKLIDKPEHPFVLILGGGKVADKLPLLYNMLGKVDVFLLNPAIVFSFMLALGKNTGKSLVDPSQQQSILTFMRDAQANGTQIILPVDYQIASNTFEGPLSLTQTDEIPDNGVGISIGPKTQALFRSHILKAKTIFFNGLPGDDTRPDTLHGAHALFKAMADSEGYSVIGGGDSVGIAENLGLTDKIDYLSTGGGATLAYLAGQPLPGLAFIEY